MRRIGTRKSRLACMQVEEFLTYFPDEKFEIVYFDTEGDTDKTTPISDVEGTGFFTGTIDNALQKGVIDIAVHSAKDLPPILPNGIEVMLMTESIDPSDVLVSKNNLRLFGLPAGARIGASSARRKAQIAACRPDLDISDIRGNIDERIEKLDRGEYDAIVVAGAAMKRLGLENRITEVLPFEADPLQGRLAVTARSSDCGKGLFRRGRTG